MHFTIKVNDYRGLRRIDWPVPSGASVLVGPNGSGKTTLLDVLDLLRLAYTDGLSFALTNHGGISGLKNLRAGAEEPVSIGVEVGGLRWEIQLAIGAQGGFDPRAAETLWQGDQLLFSRAALADNFQWNGKSLHCDERVALRTLADHETTEGKDTLSALVSFLKGYRLYHSYEINQLRRDGSTAASKEFLYVTGSNVFSLLRQWRDKKEWQPRYDFVLRGLKAAFPDFFRDLEFESAGLTVTANLYTFDGETPIPAHLAANGWWMMLLHLCAIASTERGGAVAIDEPENGLHPFAIHQLIEYAQRWSRLQKSTVLFATHSPVFLNELKQETSRIFVMQPGEPTLPARLDQLRSPEWLAQFSLGDLYMNDEFGAPLLNGHDAMPNESK